MTPKALQMILGHADIGTTMDIYVTLDQDAINNEMNEVGNQIVKCA